MKLLFRILSLSLCFILLICTWVGFDPCAIQSIYASEETVQKTADEYLRTQTYENYIDKVSVKEEDLIAYIKTGADIVNTNDGKIIDYQGENNVIELPVNGRARWNFDIQTAGLYQIQVKYCSLPQTATDMDIGLRLNDTYPFYEAQSISLPCIWQDAKGILRDERDNDIRPKQQRMYVWESFALRGNNGTYSGNYKFEFKKGLNSVEIYSNSQPIAISTISVYNDRQIPTYSEVAEQYKQKGYKAAQTGYKIQAEVIELKSASMLYPVYDRVSATTEPQDAAKIRINMAGGQNWKTPGQWLSWKLDIPEDGLYKIGIKFRQSYLQGMFSSRLLTIDGKSPFKEISNLRFPYTEDWSVLVPGGEEPYLIYLKKGTHDFRLENITGDISETLGSFESLIYELNDIYRKIIMISSTKPDMYRDYFFDKQIPELKDIFIKNAELLKRHSKRIKEITGSRGGSETAMIESFARQLEGMASDPMTIAQRMESFKNNISALSAWVLNMKEQPLDIDYIEFLPPTQKPQSTKSGFFKTIYFEASKFLASFFEDYSLTGKKNADGKKNRKVKVWVSLGRDQAGIIKDMITDMFTPETGIDVELELVQGALIESTLAGRGPDVALMQAGSQPVNFAIRGALVDLTVFPDYEDTVKQFYPSAIVPYTFKGGVYALPDTQTYYTMFYRSDILKQLNLKVPKTWKEFYQIVPILQRYNMEVGLPNVTAAVGSGEAAPPSQTLFSAFLFQNGGRYYKDDLKNTAFDEEAAKKAFSELSYCYTRYGFPLTYDFYNRFRTGEMPIGIQPYTMYNQLYAAAPEIKGLWGMSPIPGTLKEDGTIDLSQGTQGSGCIIFQKAKDKEAAWKFIKWFTGKEAQARYGLELESIMGPAARYASANIEAVRMLPWNIKELNVLEEQWKYVRGVEELPGSYFTAVGLQNAFRTAILEFVNPYEALHTWNIQINDEIKRKYDEFGIN